MPIFVEVKEPGSWTSEGLKAELQRRLGPAESKLVLNPLTSNSEMDRWASDVMSTATNEMGKARALFDAVVSRPNAGPPQFQSPPTAQEVYAAWRKAGTSLGCQELAFLYEAVGRAAGLRVYHVWVDEDCYGKRVEHGCAAVFVSGKALLVDPAYFLFGVPHRKFRVLDDLRTLGLYCGCGTTRIELCDIGAKLAPDLAIVQMSLFDRLAGQNRWSEAEERLAVIRRLDPEGPTTYVGRGRLAVHAGRLEEAIELMRKAVELSTESSSVHFALADVYGRAGRLSEAREQCREVLRYACYGQVAAAAEGTLAFIAAQECQGRGDWDGVLSNCEATIHFRPDYAPGHFGRGAAKYLKGDLGGAVADLRKAAEVDPQWALPSQMLGCVLYEQHEFTKAVTACRRASKLEPGDDYCQFRLWLSRSRLGEAAAATEELDAYRTKRWHGTTEDWAAKIAAFLVGEIGEPEFLSAAETADTRRDAVQRCEARFYAGTKRLLDGDREAAVRHFERCLEIGDKRLFEYAGAAAELRLLRREDEPVQGRHRRDELPNHRGAKK